MRYVDEFRDPLQVKGWTRKIASLSSKSWTLMEICGGQTHSIIKFGLDCLLPEKIRLIHGPGCPVCVTPMAVIDAAVSVAQNPKVILCSFGDMLRVPGSSASLIDGRSAGADVRVVYSPLDAVKIAMENPDRDVVFFAVGFETTAPANAAAVLEAERLGLKNFFVLISHVLVPPAIDAILSDPESGVQGFLAAGHVCTVTGFEEYHHLSSKYGVPIVITGFEPLDILQGIYRCIEQLEAGISSVVNQYERAVRPLGNQAARDVLNQVFEVCDQEWRGIGVIPRSGLCLRERYREFDGFLKFSPSPPSTSGNKVCMAGAILQGKIRPSDCPEFGKRCSPQSPLGAPMVSSEGACAAYYLYKQRGQPHV